MHIFDIWRKSRKIFNKLNHSNALYGLKYIKNSEKFLGNIYRKICRRITDWISLEEIILKTWINDNLSITIYSSRKFIKNWELCSEDRSTFQEYFVVDIWFILHKIFCHCFSIKEHEMHMPCNLHCCRNRISYEIHYSQWKSIYNKTSNSFGFLWSKVRDNGLIINRHARFDLFAANFDILVSYSTS